MEDNSQHSIGDLLLAFMMGGIVGAGITLMTARESGESLREKIRRYADESMGKADDYIDDTRDRISTTIKRGKNLYEGRKTALASAIEAGKGAYEKEKERYKEEHVVNSET